MGIHMISEKQEIHTIYPIAVVIHMTTQEFIMNTMTIREVQDAQAHNNQ
jgi:hypothetical protein